MLGIKKQDLLSILITFAVGFFLGFQLYFIGFLPFVQNVGLPEIGGDEERFTVIGELYGGCRSSCPAFEIQSDGSYRYLYTPEPGAEAVLQRGDLPARLREDLAARLSRLELESQSEETTAALCDSFSDGLDARYVVTLNDVEYQLDSCGTNVDPDSSLWRTLDQLWAYLSGPR